MVCFRENDGEFLSREQYKEMKEERILIRRKIKELHDTLVQMITKDVSEWKDFERSYVKMILCHTASVNCISDEEIDKILGE